MRGDRVVQLPTVILPPRKQRVVSLSRRHPDDCDFPW